MSIELKIAKEEDRELWDELVERSPHGTIFHTWKFLEIVEKHTKSRLYPIIGLRGTTPVGVYPLFLQKKLFTNVVLSPPSRALLLYLGPVFVDYDKLKQSKRESIFVQFQRKLNEFLELEIEYNYIRIRTSPGLIDSRAFMWTGYKIEPLYTYLLDTSRGAEYVWKNFNKQVRIDIKKTEREGVEVREGSKNDLEVIQRSIADRFIEQGLKPKDYRQYLNEIYKNFYPENLRIFVGEYKGDTVGGLTLLCYKDKASLWVGIPKTDLRGKSKFNPELSLWYSAEKYSSMIYKGIEKLFRFYQKLQ